MTEKCPGNYGGVQSAIKYIKLQKFICTRWRERNDGSIDADNKSFVRAVKKKQPSLGAKISEDVEGIQRGETHSSNKLKTGKCNQKLDSYLL